MLLMFSSILGWLRQNLTKSSTRQVSDNILEDGQMWNGQNSGGKINLS